MDWEALDKFMAAQGFEMAMEEGGPGPIDTPYCRYYINPKTRVGIEIGDVEDTSDLMCSFVEEA